METNYKDKFLFMWGKHPENGHLIIPEYKVIGPIKKGYAVTAIFFDAKTHEALFVYYYGYFGTEKDAQDCVNYFTIESKKTKQGAKQ